MSALVIIDSRTRSTFKFSYIDCILSCCSLRIHFIAPVACPVDFFYIEILSISFFYRILDFVTSLQSLMGEVLQKKNYLYSTFHTFIIFIYCWNEAFFFFTLYWWSTLMVPVQDQPSHTWTTFWRLTSETICCSLLHFQPISFLQHLLHPQALYLWTFVYYLACSYMAGTKLLHSESNGPGQYFFQFFSKWLQLLQWPAKASRGPPVACRDHGHLQARDKWSRTLQRATGWFWGPPTHFHRVPCYS